MSRIAIVGERDAVWPFAGLDVAFFPPEEPGKYAEALDRCTAGDFSMVFVTEDVYHDCSERVDELRLRPFPAVIVLPGVSGTTNLGTEAVTRAVRKALGTDII